MITAESEYPSARAGSFLNHKLRVSNYNMISTSTEVKERKASFEMYGDCPVCDKPLRAPEHESSSKASDSKFNQCKAMWWSIDRPIKPMEALW